MLLKRLGSTGLVLTLLFSLGAGCAGGSSSAESAPVKLDYWRVFDDEDTFRDIINAYKVQHPNVSIKYRKLRPEEYEAELIRAFAEGRGPDIFSVHNTKIGEMQSLMQPMPASVTLDFLESVGTLRKETVYVKREMPTITEKSLRQQFVDVVAKDVLRPYRANANATPTNRIYGLPLSVDTMVMFYNRDLLNAAGVAQPPEAWDEFQAAVTKLTVLDTDGIKVNQSGAALGTSSNVERSADLISLLMLQNGTVMTQGNSVTFAAVPEGSVRDVYPGVDAVRFYTDFANPSKEVYSWNEQFPSSFEAFANGQTAFFFGYSYHIPYLKASAPRLNYDIAKMPQIAGGKQVNYANYWVEGVANNSDVSDYAWDFIQFAASADQVPKHLSKAGKPTALRSLINTQINDGLLGVFAEQVLTADSWYRGRDADAAEKALNDYATSVLQGSDPVEGIERAAQVVRQSY